MLQEKRLSQRYTHSLTHIISIFQAGVVDLHIEKDQEKKRYREKKRRHKEKEKG